MKKILALIVGVFLFSSFLISVVDAKILRNQDIELPKFLSIIPFGQDHDEDFCMLLNEGSCVSYILEGEHAYSYVNTCNFDNGICDCDAYMNDEPLFERKCQTYFDNTVIRGWCDAGIYGDNSCENNKWIEHNGCVFRELPEKNNRCGGTSEPPTTPTTPRITSSFEMFFSKLWSWIKSLFTSN